jgi:predicted O-methyltransferase YrrM
MTYQNPNIESSYREYDLGKTIYDTVIQLKPKTVIEFGCLYGYSTVAIATALKDLNAGKLICYDLWDDYKYKHSTLTQTKENIQKHGLSDYVEFIKKDYNVWLTDPEDFDLLHLDISNTGDTILKTYESLNRFIENGSVILFEGGSIERDNIEWMIKYNAKPINEIKSIVNYKVINESFPSLSIISK